MYINYRKLLEIIIIHVSVFFSTATCSDPDVDAHANSTIMETHFRGLINEGESVLVSFYNIIVNTT